VSTNPIDENPVQVLGLAMGELRIALAEALEDVATVVASAFRAVLVGAQD
jgi:hypothetical protein